MDVDISGARARFLVELISRYADKDSAILEVGCRAGDNMVSLHRAGLKRLFGIESDPDEVGRFEKDFPEVANGSEVLCGPIDILTGRFKDSQFDVVFTVGFFFDKHDDFEWLFPELVRVSGKYLISIEDERAGTLSGTHSSYREIYEQHGVEEIETIDLSEFAELDSVFFARVFEKVQHG